MAIAALITWLIAGSAGLYMFRTWLSRGGRRHERSRAGGLPPAVIFTHLSLGALGLVAWVSYVSTGWVALAWTAVGLLMPGIGLGICTVTIWTPFPGGARPQTGMLATPAEDALAARPSNDALARTLSSEVLTGRLINNMLAGLPAGQPRPERRSRRHLAPLVPAAHGVAAFVTFVLAVVSAISAR